MSDWQMKSLASVFLQTMRCYIHVGCMKIFYFTLNDLKLTYGWLTSMLMML